MWFDADKFLIQHDALTVMWFIIFFYHFQFAHRAFCSLCLWFLSRGAEMSLPPFNPVLRWEHSPPALHCKCPGKKSLARAPGQQSPLMAGSFLLAPSFFAHRALPTNGHPWVTPRMEKEQVHWGCKRHPRVRKKAASLDVVTNGSREQI